MAWSPDGSRIATASEDQSAQVWDARTGQAITGELRHKNAVRALAWSPDGTQLATGGEDAVVRIWNVVVPETSLEAWREVMARCPYVLDAQGVAVRRSLDDETYGAEQ